jgi:hypothetical protein
MVLEFRCELVVSTPSDGLRIVWRKQFVWNSSAMKDYAERSN